MPVIQRGINGQRMRIVADSAPYDAPADPQVDLYIGVGVAHLSVQEALDLRDEINASVAKVLGITQRGA